MREETIKRACMMWIHTGGWEDAAGFDADPDLGLKDLARRHGKATAAHDA